MSNSDFLGPVSETLSFSFEGNEMCPPSIPLLFLSRGPFHVAGLVVAIVVFAVNLMFGSGAIANLSKNIGLEITKGFLPPLANLDASRQIPLGVIRLGIVAPRLHVDPSVVEAALFAFAGLAMPKCYTSSSHDAIFPDKVLVVRADRDSRGLVRPVSL